MIWVMEIEPEVSVERIKTLMENRGWEIGQLVIQSGVGYDTTYKILNTERPRTSAMIIAKYARALGCSLDYLMLMTDQPLPAKLAADPLTQEILLVLGRSSLRRRRDLRRIADAFEDAEHEEDAELWRDLQVNQRLLDMVEQLGGQELLEQLLTLLRRPPNDDESGPLLLPPSQDLEDEEENK